MERDGVSLFIVEDDSMARPFAANRKFVMLARLGQALGRARAVWLAA